jgi:hypothetical protein
VSKLFAYQTLFCNLINYTKNLKICLKLYIKNKIYYKISLNDKIMFKKLIIEQKNK